MSFYLFFHSLLILLFPLSVSSSSSYAFLLFSSSSSSPRLFLLILPPSPSQWGAADAEIKVPSGENTELKRSPFKAGVGQCIAIHATLTARDFFLAYFYLSGPFTCIYF